MTTYVPPKKNTAFVFYVSLPSVASSGVFQDNPTLAAGDAKVSIDGGALSNLATLPVVTPANSKAVKVSLSAAEMNGDNITVVLSDAAGAEWADVIIGLQTTSIQFDDIDAAAITAASTAAAAAVVAALATVDGETIASELLSAMALTASAASAG